MSDVEKTNDNKSSTRKAAYCKLSIQNKYIISQYFFNNLFEEDFKAADIELLAEQTELGTDIIRRKLSYLKKNMSHSTSDATSTLYIKDVTLKSPKITIHMHISRGTFPRIIEILEYIVANPKVKVGCHKSYTYNTILTELFYRELLGPAFLLPNIKYSTSSNKVQEMLAKFRPEFIEWVKCIIPNVVLNEDGTVTLGDASYTDKSGKKTDVSRNTDTNTSFVPQYFEANDISQSLFPSQPLKKQVVSNGDNNLNVIPSKPPMLLIGSIITIDNSMDYSRFSKYLLHLLKVEIIKSPMMSNILPNIESSIMDTRLAFNVGIPTNECLTYQLSQSQPITNTAHIPISYVIEQLIQAAMLQIQRSTQNMANLMFPNYQVGLGVVDFYGKLSLVIFVDSIQRILGFVPTTSTLGTTATTNNILYSGPTGPIGFISSEEFGIWNWESGVYCSSELWVYSPSVTDCEAWTFCNSTLYAQPQKQNGNATYETLAANSGSNHSAFIRENAGVKDETDEILKAIMNELGSSTQRGMPNIAPISPEPHVLNQPQSIAAPIKDKIVQSKQEFNQKSIQDITPTLKSNPPHQAQVNTDLSINSQVLGLLENSNKNSGEYKCVNENIHSDKSRASSETLLGDLSLIASKDLIDMESIEKLLASNEDNNLLISDTNNSSPTLDNNSNKSQDDQNQDILDCFNFNESQ
ncbi:hypothetical protein H4219_003017 [Mycoemilia scoparia]|uniref:Uncharacterized protein n=1 Tax=Mycoemilia scoparia TaxID=417184 RepID=A0A9W8DT97_9FUNG|nr:hypothetical protein H4219_003017 [Mycoemilia scoparia]